MKARRRIQVRRRTNPYFSLASYKFESFITEPKAREILRAVVDDDKFWELISDARKQQDIKDACYRYLDKRQKFLIRKGKK